MSDVILEFLMAVSVITHQSCQTKNCVIRTTIKYNIVLLYENNNNLIRLCAMEINKSNGGDDILYYILICIYIRIIRLKCSINSIIVIGCVPPKAHNIIDEDR